MAISIGRAKALCSDTELALVKASTKQEIGRHTTARLRQMETRARKLRDKWRDQAASQRRSKQAKVGARDVDTAARSAEKAELFDEVLSRFTAQSAKAEAASQTPGPMGRRRSARSKKSTTNRATRSGVRDALQEIKRDLDPPQKKKLRAAAKAAAAPAEEVIVGANDEAAVVETMPKKPARPTKPARKKTRQPVGSNEPALLAGRDAQGLRVTKQQQLQARTAAKQDRLQASGLIRIQKNRSAANKRSQGRRDSR